MFTTRSKKNKMKSFATYVVVLCALAVCTAGVDGIRLRHGLRGRLSTFLRGSEDTNRM